MTYFENRDKFLTHLAQRQRDLAALAEFVEANPDLPVPYAASHEIAYKIQVAPSGENPAAEMARLARLLSPCRKQILAYGQGYAELVRSFGSVELNVWTTRDAVCERVVVGTETIQVPTVTYGPPTTEQREIVEWKCAPILAGTDA